MNQKLFIYVFIFKYILTFLISIEYILKDQHFFQLEMENDDVIEVYQEQTGGR